LLGLFEGVEGHDFDEIDPPPGADTAWRHRAYSTWIDKALALQRDGIDLLLCGQTPFGELLAAPNAKELEAISACLIDCDDITRAMRLEERGERWFERTAGSLTEMLTWPDWVQIHLNWADWLRHHADDPTWMQHVIRIQETASEMQWDRWIDWQAGDPRWRVHVIDTSNQSRADAAAALARWIGEERDLYRAGRHPLATA
jgi:hypothetical protein